MNVELFKGDFKRNILYIAMYFLVLPILVAFINIISAEFIESLYTSFDVNTTSKNFLYNQKSDCALADGNCAILGRVFIHRRKRMIALRYIIRCI